MLKDDRTKALKPYTWVQKTNFASLEMRWREAWQDSSLPTMYVF